MRRRAMILGGVLLLAGTAMAQPLRDRLLQAGRAGLAAVQTFASSTPEEAELTLPEIKIWALQLGVFDSGERAAQEQERLLAQGIPCAFWQREQMRLICEAALAKEALDMTASGGQETFVIAETAPQISLRLSAAQGEAEEAAAFLALPDGLLERLSAGEPLKEIMIETRETAERALRAHPQNTIYTQLAQSLLNWCALMEQTMQAQTQAAAAAYARVTMYMLCRELRLTLNG